MRIPARRELSAPAFLADAVGGVATVAGEADLLSHERDRVGERGHSDDGQFRRVCSAAALITSLVKIQQKRCAGHPGIFINAAMNLSRTCRGPPMGADP